MILLVKSYPYHFVRTILSLPLCPIPFCPYTILSVLFCPLPFCPRTVHTIAKKCSTGTTSKYSPICPKFCTQLILLCVTRAALWSHAFPTFSFLGHTNAQSALEFFPIHCPNGHLGQDLGFGGFAFALKLLELLNTNLVT